MDAPVHSWSRVLVIAFTACAGRAEAVSAQQPGTTAPSAAASLPAQPAYRPPVISLVQPPLGGSVPSDRPVVVFRFAPGEAADPIDVRSLVVSVDGRDRSKLFQATSSEAWGSLAARDDAASTGVEAGTHHVVARICSIRGACSEVATVIQVVASTVPDESIPPRRRALLDLLVEAARKLLKP